MRFLAPASLTRPRLRAHTSRDCVVCVRPLARAPHVRKCKNVGYFFSTLAGAINTNIYVPTLAGIVEELLRRRCEHRPDGVRMASGWRPDRPSGVQMRPDRPDCASLRPDSGLDAVRTVKKA